MNEPLPSGHAPAGAGRRVLAAICNTAILAIVVVLAVRYIADITQEPIPASISDAGADACAALDQQVSTTWCEVRGDRVYYTVVEQPFARVVLPPLVVSFANSVLLAWLTGASVGKHLLGLTVVRRATGRRAGLGSHLLRWPLWPVGSFGAAVVRAVPVAPTEVASTGTAAEPDGLSATSPAPAPTAHQHPVVDPARPVGRTTDSGEAWWPFADADAAEAPPVAATSATTPSDAGPAAPVTATSAAPGASSGGAAPTTPADVAAAPVDPSGGAPATGGPQWDAQRQAYIQWEPVSMQWMAYDQDAQRWIPLTEGP